MTPSATENSAAASSKAAERPAPMVEVEGLAFSYGSRPALEGVSLTVGRGEIFGLLGPNGSGKTTFFRILSTALRAKAGRVRIDGRDPASDPAAVRRRIGVAFQSPSLDNKLTVAENVRFHGMLFGIRGRDLRERTESMLERFSLADRSRERVETLSGGLKRRVELAKALLPAPPLLLLDEPSTGLDPAARLEFWRVLEELRAAEGLTVVLATHLMDEAERCDRVALLDRGRLVAADTPEALRRAMGGEVLSIEAARDAPALADRIAREMGLPANAADGRVRLEVPEGLDTAARLLKQFPDDIRALTLGRPTLEDVFLAKTGRSLDNEEETP